jgi:anti-sigma factor RsiW
MGARHVDELFSAAYDDALDASQRRRYEQHLGECEQCATAAAEFRTAIEAVRGLPVAQMPVRVVLPATPPVAERGWRGRALGDLPAVLRRRMTPAVGATVMGLAGIAAVVLVVHGHVGGGASNSVGSRPNVVLGAAGSGAGPALAVGTCPMPLAVTSGRPGTSGTPAGFANRVSVTLPQRPGEELVLATTSDHYAPGSQVLVYAALTTSSATHAAVVPCVSMHTLGAVAVAPGQFAGGATAAQGQTSGGAAGGPSATSSALADISGGNGGGSNEGSSVASSPSSPQAFAAAPAPPVAHPAAGAPGQAVSGTSITQKRSAQDAFAPYGLLQPLAVARPTASAYGSLPFQVIQIPSDIAHGTVLRLIALVPAGLPGSGDSPAIEAVLTIDVS